MNTNAAISNWQRWVFGAFGALTAASCALAFYVEKPALAGAPLLLLVMAWGILNYKSLYYFLLIMVPCSIEYYFSDSLATDLPTEPLMIGMMLIGLVMLVYRATEWPKGFFLHPLMIALGFHLFWIVVTAINSENVLHSVKILLAKTWYIMAFTVMTALVVQSAQDIRRMFWCIFIPLIVLTLITVMRHGLIYQFGFAEVNKCVTPYFRNHVNYAAILSVFFPFVLLARSWYEKGTWMHFWLSCAIVFLIAAIYLSYTRTAMLAVLAMIPFYFVVRWKLMRYAMLGALVLLSVVIIRTVHNNHYMKYAPDFEATVYHDDFGSHVGSTFEGKDVSSMERVYRWVAAMRMARERPWMGVGPGNFFDYYKSYTVTNFETYISDNEERSTVHNYFLLMLSEQGFPGLLIFLGLMVALFLYGERIYARAASDADRRTVMMLLLMLLSVYVNLLLSDMLESDKVGPFFFMAMALLVLADKKIISAEG
ncbi:MAG: O-antigen ligase family protein [Chitinophagales bacterium]